jgi:hypothetical protein
MQVDNWLYIETEALKETPSSVPMEGMLPTGCASRSRSGRLRRARISSW